jgi:glycosyltransferase involved in cell wall biosynthesis
MEMKLFIMGLGKTMVINISYIEAPKGNEWNTGGGNAYRKSLLSLTSQDCDIEPMGIIFNKNGNKIFQGCKTLSDLLYLKGQKDIWIRDYLSVLTLPFDHTVGKNIAIVHHIDNNYLSYPFLCNFMDKIYYSNLKNVDLLVVVSKYWIKYFESYIDNIKIIYNCFDMNEFQFTEEEVTKFKLKYNLLDKPIIYLGNCQKSKGVVDAYNELKSLNAYLVTSGQKKVDIPAINLDLNYRDYLRLLKASTVVVTMSLFKEGWCRTAHEAMLCKTPVVGSGAGGMAELLKGGKQIICENFENLKNDVEYLLESPEVGEYGFIYASQKQFTEAWFKKEWITSFLELKTSGSVTKNIC